MTEVFLGFFNRSCAALWLVLAVLVARLLLRRGPRWVAPLLWGLVALRLLCPFTVESALSLLPSGETVSPNALRQYAQEGPAAAGGGDIVTSGVPALDSAANAALREALPSDAAAEDALQGGGLRTLLAAGGWVWLAGAAGLLAYLPISTWRLRRRVADAVHQEGNVYRSESVASPFILGVLRPRIYLPCSLGPRETACVLAHERAHLARRDHWWKPLGFALLALYWFNPALWLAYLLFCRDVELACDERVVRTLDGASRADYSQALLSCSAPRRAVSACPLAFGEVGVKERVKRVLHYKRPAFWAVALSLAACAALAVCFLTSPRRGTMQWAKSLDPSQVASIELRTLPGEDYARYETQEELAPLVALINSARGRYVSDPEPLAGSCTELSLTMRDGTRHLVANEGNVYLHIDGDTYAPGYDWLAAWDLPGKAAGPEGPSDAAQERPLVTVEGTVLTCGAYSYDLADSNSSITAIDRCDFVGDTLVVAGHVEENYSIYFLFAGDGSAMYNCFWGSCLTWWEEDLATAVYADEAELRAIDGTVIAGTTLAGGEFFSSLAYSADGGALTAVISRGTDQREFTFPYAAAEASALHAASGAFHGAGWSMTIYTRWQHVPGAQEWRDGSGASLRVTEVEDLAAELTALKNAGHTAESRIGIGYYLCHTQAGTQNTTLYFFPSPGSAAGYRVETSLDTTGDATAVERKRVQLQVMAESFSPQALAAFDPAGEYTDSMGSDLTVRKTNGGYRVDFGIYKAMGVEHVSGTYDSARHILRFSGTDDLGQPLAAAITADGTGRLTVTLTECGDYGDSIRPGSAFSFWPRVTGDPAYDQILAEVNDRRLSGDFGDSDTDLSGALRAESDYFQAVGWALADIDGNGTDELLLGADWSNSGVTPIYNIYTCTGGTRAVSVIPAGWERSRYFLTTDGLIAHESSSGAGRYGTTYYRYSESTRAYGEVLTPVETICFDAEGDPGGYFHTAEKPLEQYSAGDPAFVPISDQRAEELMGRHAFETLVFTPFLA